MLNSINTFNSSSPGFQAIKVWNKYAHEGRPLSDPLRMEELQKLEYLDVKRLQADSRTSFRQTSSGKTAVVYEYSDSEKEQEDIETLKNSKIAFEQVSIADVLAQGYTLLQHTKMYSGRK
jgi:hypothetical protein